LRDQECSIKLASYLAFLILLNVPFHSQASQPKFVKLLLGNSCFKKTQNDLHKRATSKLRFICSPIELVMSILIMKMKCRKVLRCNRIEQAM
jgi:hypothetical protein